MKKQRSALIVQKELRKKAIKCKHCHSMLEDDRAELKNESEDKSEIKPVDSPHLDKELESSVSYFFEVVKEVYEGNFNVREANLFRGRYQTENNFQIRSLENNKNRI